MRDDRLAGAIAAETSVLVVEDVATIAHEIGPAVPLHRMHAVFADPPLPKDGLFHLPQAPGLGLTLVETELAQRRVAAT